MHTTWLRNLVPHRPPTPKRQACGAPRYRRILCVQMCNNLGTHTPRADGYGGRPARRRDLAIFALTPPGQTESKIEISSRYYITSPCRSERFHLAFAFPPRGRFPLPSLPHTRDPRLLWRRGSIISVRPITLTYLSVSNSRSAHAVLWLFAVIYISEGM